jgi:hypothetical protein
LWSSLFYVSDEGRYKFNYLVCVSFLRRVVCCVFVSFDLALCTLCCQFLSFIHSWLSLRFPLTEIYFVLYLLFKKLHLIKYFVIKDSMSEWRFLGVDPQRWMATSMKDDQCRCSGCPTPPSFCIVFDIVELFGFTIFWLQA